MQIVKYLLHYDIVHMAIVLVSGNAQNAFHMHWIFLLFPFIIQRTNDVQGTNCIVGN